jgi:hypothetical protein
MAQESENELARHAGQIAAMKEEIDALQVQTRHFIKPWYKEGASLVSALALLFSFGTTGVSYFQAKEAEVQRSRTELRELILKLGQSPRQLFEFQQRYRSDAQAVSNFSSLINQENIILAKQASQIIWKIPSHVSAIEHVSVGTSLMQSNLPQSAQRHFEAATETASDINEVVGAHRALGMVEFQLGDPISARQHFGNAKSIMRSSSNVEKASGALLDWADATTEIRWAQSEAAAGFCTEFTAHLGEAIVLAQRVPPAWAAPVLAEAEQVRQQGCPPGAYVPGAPADGSTAAQ